MGSAAERLGRLLVERAALGGGGSDSGGTLVRTEVAALTGLPVTEGRDREEIDTAYEPALATARKDFVAELEQDVPLGRVVRYAGIDEIGATVLAVCIASELDPDVTRLLTAVHRDPGAGLTVGALRVVIGDAAAAAIGDEAPLRRAGLVRVGGTGPLGTRTVQLATRVAWALLDDFSLDPELRPGVEIALGPADAAEGAERLLVSGPDRVRRIQAATTSAAGLAFLVSTPPVDERGWEALVAQATVVGAGVILDLAARSEEAPDPLGPVSRRWLERATHLPIAVCSADPIALESLPRQRWEEVAPSAPEVDAAEWSAVFGDADLPARRPSAEQLRSLQVVAGEGVDPALALRRLASGSLLQHARRVEPRASWDDLILPPAQERQLRALVDRYRHRARVHEEWHLPLYPSPGVVALFSGHSGTGKTTSAEVIAHELGVDLFRVDLSALVSKYIGETEKNLEQIFSAAHAGNYLLLFDEADSLFGSRSAVTDARDRYANMEVSYLLQRLETYDGFVVLTSNFQGNIDDAFLRRIHATVSFPMPSAGDRERIWDRCLADAPRGEVDLAHVARSFEISGGSIRNAALSAAFLAAGRGRPIGMVELLAAVVEELAKLRQRVSPAQLGPWAAEVSELVGGLSGPVTS